MHRRHLCLAALLFGAAARHACAQAAPAPLRRLAVLDFELVDDPNNPATPGGQALRLAAATRQLADELAQRRLYEVVDLAPAQELLTRLRNQQEYMHRCDDCAVQVGKMLGIDLVMGTWVQKMSELILHLNVQIVDVRKEAPIFAKSVVLRGNDEASWTRAVRFLVRDMAEKRERNPRYGQ